MRILKYYLGIDGGGTKTKVCIIDENENIIGISQAGPSSIDTVTNEKTYQNFLEPINQIINSQPNIQINKVFAGIGGIVTAEDEKLVEVIIHKLPFIRNHAIVKAKNDMFNALYSGLLFDEGMALVVGTGSVAFGKDQTAAHKCGGWGYKEGDAGSAYDLGKQALKLLVRNVDGRIPNSTFTDELKERIKIKSIYDIVPVINDLWENRTKTASFARIVTSHANRNNPDACKIVDMATDELKLMITGVYNKLVLSDKTIVIVGSLGNAKGYFQDQLHKKIKSIDININIIVPIVDPAIGAALMAKKM
ncbi:MAG: hypothetical protein M0R05_05545 [Bacilli bacterium]|nr:hypothetical protein [Bacilli bacterium]